MNDDLTLADRLVDAVLSVSPNASKLALEYFHEGLGSEEEELDSGGIVLWHEVPEWFERVKDDDEALEASVSAERYEAIVAGARVARDEIRTAVQQQLHAYFEEPLDGWVYRLLRVVDSHGRQVVASIIIEGCSWEGLTTVLMGIHRSRSDAIANLKQFGLLEAKDLGETLPKTRRLSDANLKARMVDTRGTGDGLVLRQTVIMTERFAGPKKSGRRKHRN